MQATRLANGVRVLSERLPDLTSTTVGIWVENGSRYERAEQAGISHFLEHLFFKGTARRTAAQIAQEIDARSEEHTSELQSPCNLVCRLLLEKKNQYEILVVS